LSTAYIALGSNLGDRAATLRQAVDRLTLLGSMEAVSPFIETAPVGMVDQPPFLNAAAMLSTILPPRDLLAALHAIEQDLGRVRTIHTIHWGPRTLDLDLLLYDDLVIALPGVTVPHPRMHERRFVLEPLAAIAPTVQHPVRKQSAADMLRLL